MKSFYCNDYLIEVNEKRCAAYVAATQQFSNKFNVLMLIYSLMSVSLYSLCREIFAVGSANSLLLWIFGLFAFCFSVSIVFTFLLLIPDEHVSSASPMYYSSILKKTLESRVPKNEIPLTNSIDNELSCYYLADVERTVIKFYSQMKWKRLCYTFSLFLTSLSLILYSICIAILFLIH